MPEKYSGEKEEEAELTKIWTKKLNKFFSDYFNWIIALTVAAIFIFGFFFLLAPKYDQTVKYVDIFNQQEELDVQVKKNELAQIKDLLAAYNSIDQKYIDKIGAVAPPIKNKEELFSEINYLMSRNQLSLQSVSLSDIGGFRGSGLVPPTAADGAILDNLQEVNVSLSASGISNYETFKNFLASLENNLHLVDILTLNFSPGNNGISLSLKIYYSNQ